MTTTPATQAILPEDIERAEKFRRGIGGRYDRDVDQMAAEFARCRQAHSLPGDALREAWISDAVDTACDGENGKTNGGDWEARWQRSKVLAALTPSALSGDAGERWQLIDSAPKDGTEIQARIPGNGEDNVIAWVDDLIDSNGEYCGAWAFTRDQEPPDCWTDGYCWEVNEDGDRSVQPTHWAALATEAE